MKFQHTILGFHGIQLETDHVFSQNSKNAYASRYASTPRACLRAAGSGGLEFLYQPVLVRRGRAGEGEAEKLVCGIDVALEERIRRQLREHTTPRHEPTTKASSPCGTGR